MAEVRENYFSNEMNQLQTKWRKFHLRTFVLFSVIVFFCELVMSLVISKTNFLDLDYSAYLFKYLFLPGITYLVLNIIVVLYINLKKKSERRKKYLLSVSFSVLCSAICYYHDYFVGVYALGIIAIIVTIVYCDKKLTNFTAAVSLISESLIGILGRHDKTTIRDDNYYTNLIIFMIFIIVCSYICTLTINWLKKRVEGNSEREYKLSELEEEAVEDAVTGLHNRRGLQKFLENNYSQNIYLLADISNFKTVFDTWGTQTADKILKNLASVLRQFYSDDCSVFRFFGDEFLLIFKNNLEREELLKICKKIESEFKILLSPEVIEAGIGMSFGIALNVEGDDPDSSIHRASIALSKSKNTPEKIFFM